MALEVDIVDQTQDSNAGGATPPRSDLVAKSSSLLNAAKSLRDLTERLSENPSRPSETPANGAAATSNSGMTESLNRTVNAPPGPQNIPRVTINDASAQRYYAQLLQRGELVDVDEHTDLSKLSPGITHIRYPDGHVERLGFS